GQHAVGAPSGQYTPPPANSHYRPADRTQLQWQEPYRPGRAGSAGEKGGLTSTAQVAPTMANTAQVAPTMANTAGAQSAASTSVASASATSTTAATENGKGEKGPPGQGQTNGAEGPMAEAGSV
ncbi:hypothetical protein K525DRAFT_275464, partial [Schizophyllum commune Loenen D]